MIKLKLFKQSRGYCGPASLKMVLSSYGINKSEKYLAKLTKTSRTEGCYEKNIIEAAEKLGLNGYVKQKSSIRELRELVKKKVPVIVNWFSPEEGGHYSVIVGFEKNKIILADPHFGELKKYKIDWFEDRWFDFIGPASKNNLLVREIIVIYRDK
ncbi:MAG: C39 family peptidase [Parcubacteria group bacterium]|nr:C39 family peptidase [Parcubacteria group bacterium]